MPASPWNCCYLDRLSYVLICRQLMIHTKGLSSCKENRLKFPSILLGFLAVDSQVAHSEITVFESRKLSDQVFTLMNTRKVECGNGPVYLCSFII